VHANPPDLAVAELARRQHGVFSTQQAAAVGITPRMRQRRLSSGAWLALDRSVHSLRSSPPTFRRQLKAAELSVPGSAISGRSAAVLHCLSGFRPGTIEVSGPRGGRRRSSLAIVRNRAPVATTHVDGIQVTTIEQTLCDLAACAPDRLDAAIDDALVRGLTDARRIAVLSDGCGRRRLPGAASLAAAIEERGEEGYVPPGNVLERALRRALAHPGLPPATFEAPLPWRPAAPQRVDALLPSWRRIVEADGRRWHTRRADFERDRQRDHAAQAHGFEVTRFSYDQLVRTPDHATQVLLEIGQTRSHLGEAA
jgi:hypothetical protein